MTEIFASNITPEVIETLPLVQFKGKIELVDTFAGAHKALSQINDIRMLGFDTESKPSFKKGQYNKIALMQLADSETCFIFRLNKIGLSNELVHLLSDKKKIKVGLSVKDDLRELHKLRYFQPEGFIDLQNYVEKFGIKDKSLKKLAALITGIRISKSQQRSNWENATLTDAQLCYAATDAWICYEMYMKLKEAEGNMERIN
jgi:ribonuclease D